MESLWSFLSFLFEWSAPKYLAYFILLLSGVWIVLIWTGKTPFSILKAKGKKALGTIYTALLPVIATVGVLVISLMLVAVQLSAAAYTPRVIKIHFSSFHFIGLGLFFLGTIVYLTWQLARSSVENARTARFTETGFVLSFASLLLLIPYLWISVRLLQPQHLCERLLEEITREDFHQAAQGNPEQVNGKLQPVVDIIRRATADGQLRTVEEGFNAMIEHIKRLEGNSKDEMLSKGIGVVFAERLLEIGRYANSIHCFEVSTELLSFIDELAYFYEDREIRTGILEFRKTLNPLACEWGLRYPRGEYPLEYAQGLFHIGGTYLTIAEVVEKEKREYLEGAISAYKSALEVYTKKDFPSDYAATQSHLGIAYWALAEVSAGEKIRDCLENAVKAYNAALEVRTQDKFPADYAAIQNNLGVVYRDLAEVSDDKHKENYLQKTVEAYTASLSTKDRDESPVEYALTQHNLGGVYIDLAIVSEEQESFSYLKKAIETYEAALEIRTSEEFPVDYALSQNNLGIAYDNLAKLSTGDEKRDYVKKAINAYNAASEVFTREEFPVDYANTQNNLGAAYWTLAGVSQNEEKRDYLEMALKAYNAALGVRTKDKFPADYAMTKANLGFAYWDMIKICKPAERKDYYQKAHEAFEAACWVWTEEHFPHYHKILMGHIAVLEREWERLQKEDKD